MGWRWVGAGLQQRVWKAEWQKNTEIWRMDIRRLISLQMVSKKMNGQSNEDRIDIEKETRRIGKQLKWPRIQSGNRIQISRQSFALQLYHPLGRIPLFEHLELGFVQKQAVLVIVILAQHFQSSNYNISISHLSVCLKVKRTFPQQFTLIPPVRFQSLPKPGRGSDPLRTVIQNGWIQGYVYLLSGQLGLDKDLRLEQSSSNLWGAGLCPCLHALSDWYK